jgi:hypothetical protein
MKVGFTLLLRTLGLIPVVPSGRNPYAVSGQ